MSVADVLLAIAQGAPDLVERAAAVAEDAPRSLVAPALASYLATARERGVYEEPSGFQAFIDHGGNPRLYASTHLELGRIHAEVRPKTVADIGCGDGRVTHAVLRDDVERVTLVEPSEALLAEATARLQGVALDPHPAPAGQFLAAAPPDVSWDLVQSTFALHTISRDERLGVLRDLAARTTRLAVVEFDLPEACCVGHDRSAEHAAYAAEKYELGFAEYASHPEVITGFLLPVLVGQFAPDTVRHTFEQPASAWVQDLEAAGFTMITTRPVDAHWWAPAVLFDAAR